MKPVFDLERCYGCGACSAICPKSAIEMGEGDLGFSKPRLDPDKCIECGLCRKVCPYEAELPEKEKYVSKGYAVINLNENERMASRSGGVFPMLCREIISRGGTVYGASFDKDLRVKHERATTLEECYKFSGSKYVESKVERETLLSLLSELKDGKPVLFSGTPCQCYGVRSLVELKDPGHLSNLYLSQVMCFGTMSPEVYEEYLVYISKKGHFPSSFSFRDKRKGWDSHYESYTLDGRLHFSNKLASVYSLSGLKKSSCWRCGFACAHQYADLTLADAWALEKFVPEYDFKKGVSLLLVNTSQGERLFDVAFNDENCKLKEIDEKDVLDPHRRPSMFHPNAISPFMHECRSLYEKEGLKAVIKKTHPKWKKMVRKDRFRATIRPILVRLGIKKP